MGLFLFFTVALPSEARPLIERYRLERREADGAAFEVHRRDDVGLVVSGPGKTAAAAASAYLHLAGGGVRQAAWLNVGIAGHGRLTVGEAVMAHKVRDRASGQCWYPPLVFEPRLATAEVITVDAVEQKYEEDAAYEMEASGFYPTACRFATAELVHCLKVVSDGPGAAPQRLTAAAVEQLIGDRLAEIERLADAAGRLAAEARRLEDDPPEMALMLERWHFTVTERRQLRRLLERRRTLRPGALWPAEIERMRRGRDVLRHLRGWLDALPVEVGR